MYISYVAKASLFTAVFSQLSIFTVDCRSHSIQMAGVETIWESHTLPDIKTLDTILENVVLHNRQQCCKHLFLRGKFEAVKMLSDGRA